MMLFDDMVTVHVEIIVILTSVGPWLLYIYCTTLDVISKSRGIDDGSVCCINAQAGWYGSFLSI